MSESARSRVMRQVQALSQEQRALLELRLRETKEQATQSTIPKIQFTKTAPFCPLSFAQQSLWFLAQVQPDSPFYNIAMTYTLRGTLHITALEHSLHELVRRHEILRTSFIVVEDSPAQRVNEEGLVSMPIVDLHPLPATVRTSQLHHLIAQEAQQPFDLVSGPLWRVTLVRSAEEEHILLLTMHHIITDGWSSDIFLRELAVLYNAYVDGKPHLLPEMPIQYRDYVTWQQNWLQGQILEKHLTYWRQQLKDAPAILPLPTDYPRPMSQSFRGALKKVLLPKDLHERLKALSQQIGVTLFMTLLAAWKILLLRYTQQEDIIVGTPIANRNRPELENLIGFFVNTVILRTDLSDNPRFVDLLGRIRRVTVEAYTHQDLPFEKLVEDLHPRRDMSYTPLIQVLFVLHNTPGEDSQFAGLQVTARGSHIETAKFDLTLSLKEMHKGLSCWLEYSINLFDAATIERMLGHFQAILEGIVANPQCRILQLPILTEAEHHQLLVEWNNNQVEFPEDKYLHGLFEDQVERTPDAIALVYEDWQLTYDEVNRRANQLARHLQKRGMGPETLVGICVERSPEMIIGILGILKAGGAYVPLDSSYPQERLALILEHARPSILLTMQGLQSRLPDHQTQVLYLDSDWEYISHESEENLAHKIASNNLAYIIFTSGSVGLPKGVMVQQGALFDRIRSLTNNYKFGIGDRLLQFVSLSFDACAEEIFPTLTSGATLIMHPNPGALPAVEFLQVCKRLKITALHIPPVYWEQLMNTLLSSQQSVPEWIKLFSTGGESFSPESLLTWARLTHHPSRFINAYGPTETTITATSYESSLDVTTISKLTKVPIGRPLSNTSIYLLDAQLQPVPAGIVGELYIGGAGLARGYLNSPDLTAERFIPDPFSGISGTRIYRTGDLARYLADGTIEFLGRADHQIKIRGFRVEPSEIEAVLSQYAALQQTVVTVREDHPGDKHLVAYCVPRQNAMPTASELYRFLQEKLPGYMIPSAFVLLESLPLTPNGKIDRRTLPSPEATTLASMENYTAPRTPIEEVLAQVWAGILGREQIGVYDDFFELGGHSLLATQVISRVLARFQIDLSLPMFFGSPTIAGLADLITQARLEQTESQETVEFLEALERMPEEEALQKLEYFE